MLDCGGTAYCFVTGASGVVPLVTANVSVALAVVSPGFARSRYVRNWFVLVPVYPSAKSQFVCGAAAPTSSLPEANAPCVPLFAMTKYDGSSTTTGKSVVTITASAYR